MSKQFIFEDNIPGRHITFDGKLQLDIPYNDNDKAELNFTPKAWQKIVCLVEKFKSEVAWRGIVERTAQNSFVVTDIIIYPQTVTGASVEGDENYIFNNYTREERNTMRLHGHSHNTMCPTPSAVDISHRYETITAIGKPLQNEDLYAIFIIVNRQLDIEATIFDITNNKLYKRNPESFDVNNGDIILNVHYGDEDLERFLADAENMVSTKPYKNDKSVDVPPYKFADDELMYYLGGDNGLS